MMSEHAQVGTKNRQTLIREAIRIIDFYLVQKRSTGD